ncbi:hypothetical protein MO183_002171 [Listeria monocytogenes]|uniref:CDI immunity protein domain-containing protein n=1 Tax=Listeria monocytogenes TaxID=1639 RepID=A0AB74ND91_LISMN|nr:hypothetical protein [Listeria monocytogenes]EAE3615355.1 hypothetical protein [Listeria monocytogenes]EAE3653085.1 hypothetical protein [Listeria monocytogenes]EAE5989396.1 hypothetical protein [Listeria monocytogenes]EAE6015202.1 hypothetical protein [Listeria monocytogenes]EAF0392211.1 hypothetical protein [Listeria monocytogenes]
MQNEFQLLEDKKSIDQLMLTYFSIISGRYLKKALSAFKENEGYGQEIVFVSFKNDLDAYDMTQLPRPLDDKHVLVELGFPAVKVDQIVYLDFKTFYAYLDENVKKEAEINPEGSEFIELLKKVKSSLEI